jgi:hypothetical protein
MKIKPGYRIKFFSERQRYTVTAANSRFVIAIKPFNARKTYLYTIVDLGLQIRSSDDHVFGPVHDYSKPEEAKKALRELKSGKLKLSYRREMKLDIEKVYEK